MTGTNGSKKRALGTHYVNVGAPTAAKERAGDSTKNTLSVIFPSFQAKRTLGTSSSAHWLRKTRARGKISNNLAIHRRRSRTAQLPRLQITLARTKTRPQRTRCERLGRGNTIALEPLTRPGRPEMRSKTKQGTVRTPRKHTDRIQREIR